MEISVCADWWGASGVEAQLRTQIQSCNARARLDLTKMLNSCDRIASEISKEEVRCRQLKKQTPKHKELIATINANIYEIEKLITFGALL